MKTEGVLVYDEETQRMDIRFDCEDYYGGLSTGTAMEVLIGGDWVPTRIEMGQTWYLVGIKTKNINGLIVRI